ncbi:hypothetical protein QU38_01875, partial [Staphylococcus aureus]
DQVEFVAIMLAQPIAPETVPGGAQVDRVERAHLLPAIAQRRIEIAQSTRRRGAELAGPAVELEIGRQRRLHAGPRHARAGAQHFIARGQAQSLGAQVQLAQPIIGGIAIGVAAPIALPRPAGDIAERHMLRERLPAGEAQAPGLARQAEALQ